LLDEPTDKPFENASVMAHEADLESNFWTAVDVPVDGDIDSDARVEALNYRIKQAKQELNNDMACFDRCDKNLSARRHVDMSAHESTVDTRTNQTTVQFSTSRSTLLSAPETRRLIMQGAESMTEMNRSMKRVTWEMSLSVGGDQGVRAGTKRGVEECARFAAPFTQERNHDTIANTSDPAESPDAWLGRMLERVKHARLQLKEINETTAKLLRRSSCMPTMAPEKPDFIARVNVYSVDDISVASKTDDFEPASPRLVSDVAPIKSDGDEIPIDNFAALQDLNLDVNLDAAASGSTKETIRIAFRRVANLLSKSLDSLARRIWTEAKAFVKSFALTDAILQYGARRSSALDEFDVSNGSSATDI
jgi:hypothetical protein